MYYRTKPCKEQPFECLVRKGNKWRPVKDYCLPKMFIHFQQKRQGKDPSLFKAEKFDLEQGDLLHINGNVVGFLCEEWLRLCPKVEGVKVRDISFGGMTFTEGLDELEKFEAIVVDKDIFHSNDNGFGELIYESLIWKWVYSLSQTCYTPSRIKFPDKISVLEWAVSLGILECSR